jgi:2-polyprenyl-3-methyl-5-hydroxy-6-metoxy-1,4-benzoquinol methylase
MRIELVCPKSKTPLEISGDMLVSREGNRYPIINSIPRFVVGDNYSNSFGEQWNMFSETQLDSYSGKKVSANRLATCLGPDLWGKLANKSVLECGCGAGRFTELLLKQKASVCSVDLSSAVDANVKNCPITDEHKVFQADILSLPFKEDSFDIVLCLGVIQHTPDPIKTIDALYRQVKPGGFLIIDHYKYRLSWYLHPTFIIRFFLKSYSRKSPKACMKLIQVIVNALFPIHWKLWSIHPRLNWLFNRISPVITYFTNFPQLSREHHKKWSVLDTHDALTDWYKHRKTVRQVAEILEDLGLKNIECRYGGNGIEARGQKAKGSTQPL